MVPDSTDPPAEGMQGAMCVLVTEPHLTVSSSHAPWMAGREPATPRGDILSARENGAGKISPQVITLRIDLFQDANPVHTQFPLNRFAFQMRSRPLESYTHTSGKS